MNISIESIHKLIIEDRKNNENELNIEKEQEIEVEIKDKNVSELLLIGKNAQFIEKNYPKMRKIYEKILLQDENNEEVLLNYATYYQNQLIKMISNKENSLNNLKKYENLANIKDNNNIYDSETDKKIIVNCENLILFYKNFIKLIYNYLINAKNSLKSYYNLAYFYQMYDKNSSLMLSNYMKLIQIVLNINENDIEMCEHFNYEDQLSREEKFDKYDEINVEDGNEDLSDDEDELARLITSKHNSSSIKKKSSDFASIFNFSSQKGFGIQENFPNYNSINSSSPTASTVSSPTSSIYSLSPPATPPATPPQSFTFPVVDFESIYIQPKDRKKLNNIEKNNLVENDEILIRLVSKSLTNLGYYYQFQEKSYNKMKFFYSLSLSLHPNQNSAYNLSYYYENEENNTIKMLKYLKIAANLNCLDSLFKLGEFYQFRRKSYRKMIHYYRRALNEERKNNERKKMIGMENETKNRIFDDDANINNYDDMIEILEKLIDNEEKELEMYEFPSFPILSHSQKISYSLHPPALSSSSSGPSNISSSSPVVNTIKSLRTSISSSLALPFNYLLSSITPNSTSLPRTSYISHRNSSLTQYNHYYFNKNNLSSYSSLIYNNLGLYCQRILKNYNLMEKFYNISLKYNKENVLTLSNFGYYYQIIEKDYTKMFKYYNESIKLDDFISYYNVSFYYQYTNINKDLAIKYYNQLILLCCKHLPTFSNLNTTNTSSLSLHEKDITSILGKTYNNLGYLYYSMSQDNLMLKNYLKAIQYNNIEAMFNLGKYYEEKNDESRMSYYYLMAIKNNDMKSFYNLINYYSKYNNNEYYDILKEINKENLSKKMSKRIEIEFNKLK